MKKWTVQKFSFKSITQATGSAQVLENCYQTDLGPLQFSSPKLHAPFKRIVFIGGKNMDTCISKCNKVVM